MLSRLINRTARRFAGVDFMELVPLSRVDFELGVEKDDRVVLLLPRFMDPILGRLLQPRLSAKRKFIKITLDSRGSWIWKHLDKDSSVGDLVAGFEENFPDDNDDAPARLSGYLFNMWENKFIEFTNLP